MSTQYIVKNQINDIVVVRIIKSVNIMNSNKNALSKIQLFIILIILYKF